MNQNERFLIKYCKIGDLEKIKLVFGFIQSID